MLKNKVMKTFAAGLVFLSAQSFAAPADDARAHLKAIASGNIPEIMKSYNNTPHLEWVGGPLDGTYGTHESIQATWSKFTTQQGPLKLDVTSLEEVSNPKGATVSAKLHVKGKASLRVLYILTYREGKILNETWQIDPSQAVAKAH